MHGILDELTNVISEWGAIMDELYLSLDSNFEIIETYINKLIDNRSEILSGKLLSHQLKLVQKSSASYIDTGNELLGLDTVVRDKRGNILSTFNTPTFRLYSEYAATAAHVKNPYTVDVKNKLINDDQHRHHYYAYLSLQHKNRLSLLRNVDLVQEKFVNDEVVSPDEVKKHIFSLIVNGEFSRGSELLDLLNWINRPEKLLESLSRLKELKHEVLLFLHDVLDALFNIYKCNYSDPSVFDELVFNCLLYIIDLVLNKNHRQFQPVLEHYIEEHFDSKLAYVKLMSVLICYLSDMDHIDHNLLLNTIKSFKYIMKFITKSISMYSESLLSNERIFFENSMYIILKLVSNLIRTVMTSNDNDYLIFACIEYVPQSINDIITVFSATQLSMLLVKLIDTLSPARLVHQKLIIMSDIVHSQLFVNADSRTILIPYIVTKIIKFIQFPEKNPNISLNCVKLFGNIMDQMYMADMESTFDDITKIMTISLSTVVQILVVTDRRDQLMGYFACMLISMLRQMTNIHFDIHIMSFTNQTKSSDFLKKILLVLKNLMNWPVFPKDWFEMAILQSRVILKSLRYFSHAIRDYFFEDFDHEVWMSFFHCAFAFVMQPCLQLENFSNNKRLRIISEYNDMRILADSLIRTMWSHLEHHKLCFMPSMVGYFLEISLIPENEIRKTTIPIFFDMMQCEFYSWFNNSTNTSSCNIKGNFNDFQNKIIINLDRLITSGKGDKQYNEIFKNIMLMYSESDYAMIEKSVKFIETITNQLECLLEYRTNMNDANEENKFYYTVNLSNYYKEIQQHELSCRHLNKIYSLRLHLECDSLNNAKKTLGLS